MGVGQGLVERRWQVGERGRADGEVRVRVVDGFGAGCKLFRQFTAVHPDYLHGLDLVGSSGASSPRRERIAFCFLLVARSSLVSSLGSLKHRKMDSSSATPPPSLQTLSLASPAPSPPSPPPRPPPADTIRYERYAGEQVSFG